MLSFTYVDCLGDAIAREKLKTLVNSTRSNLSAVRMKLDEFGSTISKRW